MGLLVKIYKDEALNQYYIKLNEVLEGTNIKFEDVVNVKLKRLKDKTIILSLYNKTGKKLKTKLSK